MRVRPQGRPCRRGRETAQQNFSTDAEEFDIIVRRFMRKNNAFSHEQELRAALYDVHKLNNVGEKVSVDPDRLIEKIVISPTEGEWFRSLYGSPEVSGHECAFHLQPRFASRHHL